MSDFVDSEFSSLDLGDARRDRRLRALFGRLLDSPMQSIKSACQGWAETMAAYRIVNSPAVTLEAILQPHREATIERARAYRSVAVVQDTTELDFTKKKKLAGGGPLNSSDRRGFFLHSQYVISEDRLPLGVLETHLYARDDQTLGQKRRDRHILPIEQKESYRWLEGYRAACGLAAQLGDEVDVFSISDREGDIYEIFEERQRREQQGEQALAHWIVRANRDRNLLSPETGDREAKRLFEKATEGEWLGSVEFEVRRKEQHKKISGGGRVKTVRSARRVRQRLLVSRVTARAPFRRGEKPAPVSFWIVLAQEIDPPEGEDPIDWVLLTSQRIDCFEDAERILRLYLGRWEIEVFHRVLKTGCRVEEIQLKSESALRACLALYLVVAWRILYLTHLGRACPDLPCSVVFETAEWKSACAIAATKNPATAPTEILEPALGEFIKIVASFGGYLGRKGDGPPGPQALWQGLGRVRDFAIAWEAFGKS